MMGSPECPDWLTPDAKECWARTAPLLEKMRILSLADWAEYALCPLTPCAAEDTPMKPENSEWQTDVEHRLRRIENMVPYLFRLCAILAAFQAVVFLIAIGMI